MGLIELQAKGKARLIPITILVDGEYYDAGAYKADPVPMALGSGTVYEGYKDGVSQGLLTVAGALSAPNNVWLGEGTWQTTEELAAKKAKKPESVVPRGIEDTDAPPKLLRRAATKNNDASAAATPTTTVANNKTAPTASASPTAATTTSTATSPTTPPASTSVTSSASTSPGTTNAATTARPETMGDPNIPTLKRGKQADESADDIVTILSTKTAAGAPKTALSPAAPSATPKSSGAATRKSNEAVVVTFAAISDADGPESHSYDFPMKAGEEETFQKKILDLAAEDVIKRDHELAAGTAGQMTPTAPSKRPAKTARPNFSGINLRIFDLSSSNEPTLVLSATAEMPAAKNEEPRRYVMTMVAREDIYGELHRAFSSVTDEQHLDVIPRMELIDAVDADGDGRGELLFRQIYDTGSTYVIYRVIGAQLYPLFQGTPS